MKFELHMYWWLQNIFGCVEVAWDLIHASRYSCSSFCVSIEICIGLVVGPLLLSLSILSLLVYKFLLNRTFSMHIYNYYVGRSLIVYGRRKWRASDPKL